MKIDLLTLIAAGLVGYVVYLLARQGAPAPARNYYAGFNVDPLSGERYPDLLPSGTARPPAGAVWDETQGGWTIRDAAGHVIGVYT